MLTSGMPRPVAPRSHLGPRALPEWIRPQLTQLVTEAPDGDQWLHEIKYDGFRMHACSATIWMGRQRQSGREAQRRGTGMIVGLLLSRKRARVILIDAARHSDAGLDCRLGGQLKPRLRSRAVRRR